MKNKSMIIALLLLLGNSLYAQKYEVAFNNDPGSTLQLKNLTGNVHITGYSGTDIMVLYDGAPVNDAGLRMEKTGKTLHLICILGNGPKGNYTLKVPDRLLLQIKDDCNSTQSLTVADMSGDLEIRCCFNVKLLHIAGSLLVSTNEGKVEADLFSLDKNKPVSVMTVSGEISVLVPANATADLWLGTAEGRVFTDLPLQAGKGIYGKYFTGKVNSGTGLTPSARPYFSGRLNGGGTDIHLQSISGNIYLRKK